MVAASNVAGYLQPAAAPAPLEDAALDKFLHDVIAGVLGMSGDLVRPRWQENTPNLPARDVDWIAFGILSFDGDFNSFIGHDGEVDEAVRHENFELLVSSYGPAGSQNPRLLRDGLQIEQNRAALFLVGMGLIETGQIIPAPVMVKEVWLKRFDMRLTLARQIRREYPVLSLVSVADSFIDNEKFRTPINVTE